MMWCTLMLHTTVPIYTCIAPNGRIQRRRFPRSLQRVLGEVLRGPYRFSVKEVFPLVLVQGRFAGVIRSTYR
jgi:hypothetical protein